MKLGWELKALRDVCTVANGGTPKSGIASYWGGEVNWLTPKDMGQMTGRHIANTPRKISEEGLSNCSARLVPPNSVIMSTRAPIGHLAINDVPMAFNQGCRGLVPSGALDPLYLFHFLSSSTKALNDLGTGATFKELSSGALKDFCIPLPPLEEQKRIVAVLDEAFEGLTRARANAEANLRDLDALCERHLDFAVSGHFCEPDPAPDTVGHLFDEISEKRKQVLGAKVDALGNGFGDGRVLRDGWRWVPLGDLTSKISDGVHSTPKYMEQGVPFITVKNLTAGPGISFAETKFISESDHCEFIKRTHPEKGDILITKDGTIGVVRKIETECSFSIFVSVALVKPVDPRLSDYLTIALQAPRVQEQIVPKGAALKHLYLADLRLLPIPVGPISELQHTVAKLGEIQVYTNKLRIEFARKIEDMHNLRQSLLQKAFAGELT